jgi:hypothetical protein
MELWGNIPWETELIYALESYAIAPRRSLINPFQCELFNRTRKIELISSLKGYKVISLGRPSRSLSWRVAQSH